MIIGITGSFGAGKGTVVDYLVKTKGFKHFTARGFITQEIIKRGLPVDRNSMIDVANDLRAKNSPTYIIESLYNAALASGENAVIESIREVAGAKFIKEKGGIVLGIDAEPKLRYKRAFARASETDHVSYEEWLAQEQKETNPNDPNKQDIFGALKESTTVLNNNGTQEELFAQVEEALSKAQGQN